MPTAVVTGGSKGIGAAIVTRLVDDGWKVIAVCRTGKSEGNEHRDSGAVRYESLEVADHVAVADFGATLASEGQGIDALVNNAGLQGGAPIGEQSHENWQRFLSVNVTGAWSVTKAVLPQMANGGSIVNVGSVASVQGFANRAAYCASKHALLGLTKALAAELAPRQIRVNHLVLGSFDTPGLEALAKSNGARAKDYADRQLLGRLGRQEEAAAACAFLLSADAAFATGTSLTMDGGMLLNSASQKLGQRSEQIQSGG